MKVRAFLLALPVLVASACGGNRSVPYDDLRKERPDSGPPAYRIDGTFPDVMEFEQGVEQSYVLGDAAHVPSPGVPVLTLEGLPDGATFDGRTLTWKPPCGKDPTFYARGYGVLYVVATLKSSLDDEQFVQRRAALLVHQFKEYEDRKCEEYQP